MFTFKAGLSKERMTEIEITEIAPSTVFVSPKAPMKRGEYFLSAATMGVAISGYDFGA